MWISHGPSSGCKNHISKRSGVGICAQSGFVEQAWSKTTSRKGQTMHQARPRPLPEQCSTCVRPEVGHSSKCRCQATRLGKSRQTSAKLGRARPNPARVRPSSAKLRPSLAPGLGRILCCARSRLAQVYTFDKMWPSSTEFGASSAKFGPGSSKLWQCRPKLDQIQQHVDPGWLVMPHSCAEFDQSWTRIDQPWTALDQMRSDLGPRVGRVRAKFVEFGPYSVELGHSWADALAGYGPSSTPIANT